MPIDLNSRHTPAQNAQALHALMQRKVSSKLVIVT